LKDKFGMIKKGVLLSYLEGIKDNVRGESYKNILKYFYPEYISALVIYSALHLLDARFISQLKSTSIYATVGVTATLLHLVIKSAEGFSIGSVILGGQHNGAKNYQAVGRTLVDSFWISVIIGTLVSGFLYFNAYWIYYLYGVPAKMINIGVPFLRLRAIGVFLTFVYFSLISFMRGIKDTRTPMNIFAIGAMIFIFFDYALIFGKFGFPELKLQGSALATIIQYSSMLLMAFWYIFKDEKHKKYMINIFDPFKEFSTVKKLIMLSWPVVLDKATIASAYIWLGTMLAPMGKLALASFTVIKDIERIAFLPAIAFAQVITFLVSNDCGADNFDAIKTNIKKVMLLTAGFVSCCILTICLFPKFFIHFFDAKHAFTDFSAKVMPILSLLVFLDIFQLILSAALRGTGDVRVVMWTRFFICFCCFFPISYFISTLPMQDNLMKFILVYGTFYVSNAFATFVYVNRFRSDDWKASVLRKFNDKNK